MTSFFIRRIKRTKSQFHYFNEDNLNWSIYSFREKCFDRFNYELNPEDEPNPYLDLILANLLKKPVLSTKHYVEHSLLQATLLKNTQFHYNFLNYNPNFFGPEQEENFLKTAKFSKLAWHYFGYDLKDLSNKLQMIFIIGCGRSGTTLCSKVLGTLQNVLVLNEPKFIWMSYDPSFDVWSKKAGKRKGKLNKKYEDLDYNLQEQIKNIYFSLAQHFGKSIIVDKSPENIHKIELLMKMFPNSKFIHMTRNKKENIESICRMGDWYGVDDYKFKQIKEIVQEKKEIQTLSDKAELEWLLSKKTLEEIRNLLGNSLLEIKLEDMIKNSEEVLTILEGFLKVSFLVGAKTLIFNSIIERK